MLKRWFVLGLASLAVVLTVACQAESPAATQVSQSAAAVQEPVAGIEPGTVFAAGEEVQETPGGVESPVVPTGETMGGPSGPETAVPTQVDPQYLKNGGITVSGVGTVSAAADVATLNLGVEAFAETVKEARDDAGAANQRVVAALVAEGVAEDDIATRRFNISSRYGREGDSVIGYRVKNQLTVKARDLTKIGDLIDAVTEAGGDLTRFQEVNFSIEDPEQLEVQARAAAVEDLKAKAEQLAELMGVGVGAPVLISEGGGATGFNDRFALSAAMAFESGGASTEVRAGEVEVTVRLQAVFAIE